MNKKKIVAVIFCILCAILTNIYIFMMIRPNVNDGEFVFSFSMSSNQAINIQVFYDNGINFDEERSSTYFYANPNIMNNVRASIPIDTKYIRIDFGDIANVTEINEANIEISNNKINISLDSFLHSHLLNCIDEVKITNGKVRISSLDIDPYIVISLNGINLSEAYMDTYRARYVIYDVALCIIVDIVALLCMRHVKTFMSVPLDIYRNKDIIWDLIKNDIQSRFAGSYFGVFWAFVQPVITMLLYWFVFQVGLRSGNVSEYPFILFLMSGLIPWFYFSEALLGGANSLVEYSYLVKKVVFEVRVLPVIRTVSAIFVHLFFVVCIIGFCIFYGFTPTLYMFQLIYYIICSCFLVLGLSYITSACTVFFRDMTQIIGIFLTVGVWLTPIMWNPKETLPRAMLIIFQLNPMYYIVDGFRDALLAKQWFWDKPIWTIYFWVLAIFVYMIGVSLFNRLKIHFPDVL